MSANNIKEAVKQLLAKINPDEQYNYLRKYRDGAMKLLSYKQKLKQKLEKQEKCKPELHKLQQEVPLLLALIAELERVSLELSKPKPPRVEEKTKEVKDTQSTTPVKGGKAGRIDTLIMEINKDLEIWAKEFGITL